MKRSSIGELAEHVLASLEQEQLVKSASLTYTSKGAIAELMYKVASELRAPAARNVTYADLETFRTRYGI